IIKCSYSHIVNNISRWWKKVIISMEERFSESCDSSLGIKLNKFVVNIWGVNIHPDDNRLILHVRKKFSIKIKCHLRKLFTDMIRDRSILPNGKVLCNCSWPIISGILLPIAKESVRVILEEEYKELDETFSKVRVVDVGKSGDFSHIRKVTDDEKNNLTVRARSFISRRLNESVRSSWIDVNRTTKSYLSKYMSEIFTKRYSGSSLMNKLRCTDSDNILNVRKEYLFKIKSVIYDKFSDIINNKHKLDDGTIAGMYSWFRIYRKLLPIAKEEVKHILEDGSKALELVISRSRVVVDYTNDSRELTSKEKAIILEDVMKLVYASLKSLCGRVWIDLVTSSDGGCGDASDSAAVVGSDEGLYSDVKDDVLKINFCCEDDLVIYSAKKRVSFKINKCIRSKFSNLIKNKHKFDDGSVIGVDSWKNVSGRLLPIAIEEIKPIIERERIEINKILLGSRAVFFKLDGTSITRKLTSQERHVALLTVMRSIYEIGLSNLSRLWNGVVKPPEDKSPETCGNFMFNDYTESKEFEYLEGHSLSVGIMELREMDKAELDNIRLEFVGKLGPVIDKVVNLLPLKTDMPLSISDDIMLDVAKSSYDCFKEEGFFIKLESLLSKAKVVDTFGNDRFILDEERKSVIQAFMDNISNDRDYLVKKRIKEFMEGSSPFGGNSPAVVYNNPNSS
ncbi:hypothetical protein, partial [Candidatus Ichthyocystis hellenicum]|uniref:hypothetical protein n=1 Tax=Candidatus Ichthyocystis hellenicum TaxID=1561003 RepID=UPI001F5E66B4